MLPIPLAMRVLCRRRMITSATHGNIRGRGGGQEPHEHCLVQGDGREDQQRNGGQQRPDGYPAAVTHVTHVTNHPRRRAT